MPSSRFTLIGLVLIVVVSFHSIAFSSRRLLSSCIVSSSRFLPSRISSISTLHVSPSRLIASSILVIPPVSPPDLVSFLTNSPSRNITTEHQEECAILTEILVRKRYKNMTELATSQTHKMPRTNDADGFSSSAAPTSSSSSSSSLASLSAPVALAPGAVL
jgi:hypothetical protein